MMALRMERDGRTRFWALGDGGDLVVGTVDTKGAQAVQQRLQAQPRRQRASPAQGRAASTAADLARTLAAQATDLCASGHSTGRTKGDARSVTSWGWFVAGLLALAGGGRRWERAHRPTTREVYDLEERLTACEPEREPLHDALQAAGR